MTEQLNAGDMTEADLEGVEWLKVTAEGILGNSVNFWHVGAGHSDNVVEVYRGDSGEKTDTRMMFDEAVTALNNNEESSAADEVVGIEAIEANDLPDTIEA